MILGRDKGTQQMSVALEGAETVDIRSLQTHSLKTKPARFTSTTTRYGQYVSGKYDKKEGSKNYGIALAVYFGGTRVATHFDPPGVEQQMRKFDIRL
jgi:hypothetical protein